MFVMVEVYDGRLKHPFTCVVSGPSRSGKLTFVRNLLLKQDHLIDTAFDYVFIFLGTDTSENNTTGRECLIQTRLIRSST